MKIQLYQSVKDNAGAVIDFDAALELITGGTLKNNLSIMYDQYFIETDERLKKIRKDTYDAGKQKLPAVTWSGTFKKRNANSLIQYTNIICLDIDGLTDEDEKLFLFNRLCEDKYSYVVFTSPSGCGIKILVKVDVQPAQHKEIFNDLAAYYLKNHKVTIDPSGKDICRLCFLCHDNNLQLRKNAISFPPALQTSIPQPTQVKETKLTKVQQTDLQATGEDLYSVIHFTDKIKTYSPGNHNTYIHLFACNANRKGFALSETMSFAVAHFNNKPQTEIEATVKSAYQHNAHEHAKFKKQNHTSLPAKVKKTTATITAVNEVNEGSANSHQNKDNTASNFTKFWNERTITKGRGDEKTTYTIYEMLYVELSEFLFEQGFHLMDTGAEGWQLCFSKNGIIKIQTSTDVAQFLIQFTKKNCSKKVQEMVRKNQGKIFTENELRALDYNNVVIKADTEKESFFYFDNCWLTVTAEGITQHPYTELQQYIWASNKNKHKFSLHTPKMICPQTAKLTPAAMDCEFAKFVYYASYNPNAPEEINFTQELIQTRFQSFCCSIGFMLDGYKHPAMRKAIFALDHKVGDKYEKNGRSGKSIIPHACSFLKKSCTINGKTHDPRYAFRYEPITADAQIVNFNDMKQSFDVEEIFEVIADDYNVLRRNNGYLLFKYEASPKVWYSANGIPRGEGGSYRARMHPIEFSDYFNPEYTPFDEFGHGMLGSAWDDAEWNRFYNFMLWCVQCYKESGLVAYPKSNLDERRLVMSVQPEFIDIIENMEYMPRDERFDKAPAFNAFNEMLKNNNEKMASSKAFLKATQDYCKARGLFFNVKKNGKRDYTNNKDHYTISTTNTGAQVDLFENTKEENI